MKRARSKIAKSTRQLNKIRRAYRKASTRKKRRLKQEALQFAEVIKRDKSELSRLKNSE